MQIRINVNAKLQNQPGRRRASQVNESNLVLSKNLQFLNRFYSKLPDSIKFILDNLQAAYTRNHSKLFQKTLQALEIHLVNLTTQTEVYTSHYANLVLENANLTSDNEAFESHLVNQPNITDEPYDPYCMCFVLLSITSIFSFMFIILLVATATLDRLLSYRTVLNCFHLL